MPFQQQQQHTTERLISNRELFASMTLEAFDAKEEERKAQIKVSNAQQKKEYEERERQNINTRHIIHCMKRAFHSYFSQGGSDVLRPLDPATDFSMVASTTFDDGRTTHRGEELLGGGAFGCLCSTAVRTREQELAQQREDMESDGTLLPVAASKSRSQRNNNNNNNSKQVLATSNGPNNNNKGSSSSTNKNATAPASPTKHNQQKFKNNNNQNSSSSHEPFNNSTTSGGGGGESKPTSPLSKNANNKTVMIPVDVDNESNSNNNNNPDYQGSSHQFQESSSHQAFGIASDHTNRIVGQRSRRSAAGGGRRASRSNRGANGGFSCLTNMCGAGGASDFDTDDDDYETNSSDDSNASSSSGSDSEDDDDYEDDATTTGGRRRTNTLTGDGGGSPSLNSYNARRRQQQRLQHERDQQNHYSNSIAFEFTDFAPMCYRHIRSIFGIEPENFAKVLVNSNWHSIPTPGKSSAQLYFCGQNWVIKTMTEGESDFLSRILHRYYYHVRDNPHTLLPHFVGHHRLKFKDVDGSDMEFTFVIMQNVFATPLKIHTKFDLKGSTVGRFATAEEKKKTTCTRKDLDINRPIRLGESRKGLLLEQLRRDCDFLRRSEIMDYSFLVGIHDMSKGYPVWHNVFNNDGSLNNNNTNGHGGNNNNSSNALHENEKGIFGDFNSFVFDQQLRQQYGGVDQDQENSDLTSIPNSKQKQQKLKQQQSSNNNNNSSKKSNTNNTSNQNENKNSNSSSSLPLNSSSNLLGSNNNNSSGDENNKHTSSNNNPSNAPPPPLLSVTDPSATYAPSQSVDPIRGEDPASPSNTVSSVSNNNLHNTTTATQASAVGGGANNNHNNNTTNSISNNNNTIGSAACSVSGSTPENASSASMPPPERTSTMSVATTSQHQFQNHHHQTTAPSSVNNTNSSNFDSLQVSQQRRRRAQSGIHNHPHLLQAYQAGSNTTSNSNNNNNLSLSTSQHHHHHTDPFLGVNNNNSSNDHQYNNNSNNITRSRRGSGFSGSSFPTSPEVSHQGTFGGNAPTNSNINHQNHHKHASSVNNNNNNTDHPSPFGAAAGATAAAASMNSMMFAMANNNFMNNNNNNSNNNNLDERCFTSDSGGMLSTRRDEIYYLGVIDILQEYNWWKRAETVIMGTIHDRDHISSVDPRTYARRFIDFMESIVM